MTYDAQSLAYRTLTPTSYARAHDSVALALGIADLPCKGGECSDERHCRRHGAAADRLIRIRRKHFGG